MSLTHPSTGAPEQKTDKGDSSYPLLDGGSALATSLETTLGPNGMNKMLIGKTGTVMVTNNGSRILDRLEITDPVGRVLRTAATSQRNSVGDGSTTTVLLAQALLSSGGSLLAEGFHPTTIIQGYDAAVSQARKRLPEYGIAVGSEDKTTLTRLAKTTVTGRWDDRAAQLFADLTLSGLECIGYDESRLTLNAYAGGELEDSTLIDGLLIDMDTSSTTIDPLDSRLGQTLTAARIGLIDFEVSLERPAVVERVTVSDTHGLRDFQTHEQDRRSEMVNAVRQADIDVLFCQKSVDDAVRNALARDGTLVVERTRQDEFDAIARATGATAVAALEELDSNSTGYAGSVSRRSVGSVDTLVITDTPGQPHASILLRGGTPHVADEMQHIVETCRDVLLCSLKRGLVLPGGGASLLGIAQEVSAAGTTNTRREPFVIEAFASALEAVVAILARNAGGNPIDALTTLRNRHQAGESTVGIGHSGTPREMIADGVFDSYPVVDRCLTTAVEAACMVLRIDDVLAVSSNGSGCAVHDGHGESCAGSHAHGHAHPHTQTEDTGGYPWAISH